mmetsp:Transcript_43018/g.84553  ORF Transcript_43018/g.84553 Transcript_43018/m.84553 type:complete len:308 (+) Transcript_43018:2-925(+)
MRRYGSKHLHYLTIAAIIVFFVTIIRLADLASVSKKQGIGGIPTHFILPSRLHLVGSHLKSLESSDRHDIPVSGSGSISIPLHFKPSAATRRLEYVHITKTGGTAIEKAAIAAGIKWGCCHYLGDVHCNSKPDFPIDYTDFWHYPPKLMNRFPSLEEIYGSDKVELFTVVRNPYDRAISEYYCKFAGYFGPDKENPRVMNRWIRQMISGLKKKKHHHYVNQVEYVYDEDGKQIIQYVLKFEDNLHIKFHKLMNKFNLAIYLPLKEEDAINARNLGAKLSQKNLDKNSIQAINNYAHLDFKNFGYDMM